MCILFLLDYFQDVPLFEGIISDLFPGTSWPSPDYGVLMDALRENCKIRNLQSTKWFLKKIIQVCSHMSSFKRRILDSQFLDTEDIILNFLLSLKKMWISTVP